MPDELASFVKKHKVIGLDSMLFIYHFERFEKFWHKTKMIFEMLEQGKYRGITSVIGLIEILTRPKKEKNFYLVKVYKELITTFPNLTIEDVNLKIADLSSSLRAKYGIATPDAILIATALNAKATGFITSDVKLKKIKEIDFFILK